MIGGIRTILPTVLIVFGIGLMIAGIATGKTGAMIVGLCVTASAAYHLMAMKKQSGRDDNNSG